MRYQFRVWNVMSKKMMEWGEIFDFIVIGNIYENPELLEESK
ncbi:YopX family protein [Bacillus cereus]|nr:YopX family protein [Bacillus cereus]UPJ15598.1 YopX family protein [Bacillus cereus]